MTVQLYTVPKQYRVLLELHITKRQLESPACLFLFLVQTFRQRMRKCSGSPVGNHTEKRCWFLREFDISLDSTGINVT